MWLGGEELTRQEEEEEEEDGGDPGRHGDPRCDYRTDGCFLLQGRNRNI